MSFLILFFCSMSGSTLFLLCSSRAKLRYSSSVILAPSFVSMLRSKSQMTHKNSGIVHQNSSLDYVWFFDLMVLARLTMYCSCMSWCSSIFPKQLQIIKELSNKAIKYILELCELSWSVPPKPSQSKIRTSNSLSRFLFLIWIFLLHIQMPFVHGFTVGPTSKPSI